ncbi:MAG: RNA polymerase sigma factor [Cyclobacteriaceae bacterium]|nr:RNA polymerase sigma factor [Cyclobacteriaceae bacterium]
MLLTEPEIIKKAAAGDRSAFRMLVEMHQRFVYAVAVRVLNNTYEAEDATQETFIRLWKNLPRYKAGIKLSTWLYRIVTNICLDVLKSAHHKRNRMTLDITRQTNEIHASSADGVMQLHDLTKAVEEAAAKLPPIQKIVFVLRDLQGLTPEEVSQIMETSEEKIKGNLYHARIAIGKYLKHHYQIENLTEL